MSDPNKPSDSPQRSLVDRLNALKGGAGSAVSFDRTKIPLSGPPKPPSREDALADRLRSLRNTPERETGPPSPGASVPQRTPLSSASDLHASSPLAATATSPPAVNVIAGDDDIDNHLSTDDQVLADLLQDLGADDQTEWSAAAEPESDRVEKLLEELSKPLVAGPSARQGPDGDDPGHRSDDSDGEHMSREVEDVLARALEAAKLDEDHETSPDVAARDPDPDDGVGDDADGPKLSLPSVPTTLGRSEQKTTSAPSGDSFEADMAARMAALRAPTTKPSSANTAGEDGDGDDGGLSLPSVPTSAPAARSRNNQKKLASRTGYTDRDMETWCVACLEDGTLICPGCDDDVFCSRCWHDMHRGPSAGFAERFHRPKQFRSDSAKKRVAVGAS